MAQNNDWQRIFALHQMFGEIDPKTHYFCWSKLVRFVDDDGDDVDDDIEYGVEPSAKHCRNEVGRTRVGLVSLGRG